jgi:hypothetical protein
VSDLWAVRVSHWLGGGGGGSLGSPHQYILLEAVVVSVSCLAMMNNKIRRVAFARSNVLRLTVRTQVWVPLC